MDNTEKQHLHNWLNSGNKEKKMTLQAKVVGINSAQEYLDGHRRYVLRVFEADGCFDTIRVSETVFTKRPLPILDDIITLSFDTSF